MAYILDTITDPEKKLRVGTKGFPFGPGFTKEQVAEADSLVIVASSFEDPGVDWNEFQLTDAHGKVLHRKRLNGY